MPDILSLVSPLSTKDLEQTVSCVNSGGVVVLPTDSFYALSAGAFQGTALDRLLSIKGGRAGSPIPVLVGEPAQIAALTTTVPDIAFRLMETFWPGLLTLVLPARPSLSPILTGEKGRIGVRQPADARVCELLKHTGPLTGTSANRSGRPPAQTAKEAMQELGPDIDLLLDGGPTPGGLPSTVLQLEPEVRILREGAVSRDRLEQFLSAESIQIS